MTKVKVMGVYVVIEQCGGRGVSENVARNSMNSWMKIFMATKTVQEYYDITSSLEAS